MKLIIVTQLLIIVLPVSIFAQFPLGLPSQSLVNLSVSGSPSLGYGIAGYRNADYLQPNAGHLVSGVIQNAPDPALPPQNKLYADYYITGMDNSPFTNPDFVGPGLAAATANTPSNMPTLSNYVANNSLAYSDITFHFGQSTAANVQESWNLGADTQGSEWTGSLASTIENRIYDANAGEVSAFLAHQGTKIIEFGYSSLYEIIDYGATTNPGDDSIQAYSDPVAASVAAGLAGVDLGIANAFLDDVNANGGFVQLYFDTIQAASYITTPETYAGTDYIHANYDFSGSIMVVPEPASYGLLGGLAVITFAAVRRRI